MPSHTPKAAKRTMALKKQFSTIVREGEKAIAKSQQVSPSTKTPKAPSPVFGTSSQFKGIGRGVPGDPRK